MLVFLADKDVDGTMIPIRGLRHTVPGGASIGIVVLDLYAGDCLAYPRFREIACGENLNSRESSPFSRCDSRIRDEDGEGTDISFR